jgi:O-antigen/teichoic acid export membrane protein
MIRNILQSVVTKGLVAIINFLLLIVSARYLGAGSRGEINILVVNIAIIQILNEIYTGYSLIYFMPRYDLKKMFVTGIVFTLIACSCGNALIYAIGKSLPGYERILLPGYEWISYVISILVIFNTFNCVIILGKEKIAAYNFLSILQPGLLLLGLIINIFILRNYTIEAFIFPMLFSFLVSFITSFTIAAKLVGDREKGKPYGLWPIISYGVICQINGLVYILSNKYSYYLIPSKEQVGIYGTASSLMESVLIIANGITPVLMARVVNSGDTGKNARVTLALSKASFALSVLAVIVLFFLPVNLFVFLLGKEFEGVEQVKHYMLFYAPGIIIMSFSSIICNYFSAVGKLKYVFYANILGLLSTLSLAPFLVKNYGLEGAALTANIAYALTTVGVTFFFFKSNKLTLNSLFSMRSVFSEIRGLVAARK